MPASLRQGWRAPLAGAGIAGVLWAALLVTRGPATRPAAVVGAAVVAALGTAMVGLLARMALGTAGSTRGEWIAAMAGPIAAVAVLGFFLPDEMAPGAGLLVGLVPVAAVFTGAALGRADPAKARRFAIAIVASAGPVIAYWLVVDRAPVGSLVWQAADQVKYHYLGIRMLQGHLDDFRYMIGLPTFLAPFDLLSGAHDGSRAAANATNVVVLPTFVLLIGPLTVLAAAEAVVGVLRRKDDVSFAGAAVLVSAGLVAYARFAPGFVPPYNAELVPRRLLGLVFAPEPLTAAFLAGALWVLVSSGEGTVRWDPFAVGGAAGFVMLLREPNAGLVALAGVLAIRNRDSILRLVVAGVTAATVLATQVVIWLVTYGGIGAPNRAEQWAQPNRRRKWTIIARARYGYEGDAPPRVSLHWVRTNLREVVPPYTAVLLVLAALSLVAVIRQPRHWRLWVFCAVFVGGTLVFNAAYINVDVLFRYNSIVLLTLLVPATIGLGGLLLRRR